MNLWIDDVRKPPSDNWVWLKSVNTVKEFILGNLPNIELISLDHDAGDFAKFGGDYINFLNWLEEEAHNGVNIPFIFHIHSMNPVGRINMFKIIDKNHWAWQLWVPEDEKEMDKKNFAANLEKCKDCMSAGSRCLPPVRGKCDCFNPKEGSTI